MKKQSKSWELFVFTGSLALIFSFAIAAQAYGNEAHTVLKYAYPTISGVVGYPECDIGELEVWKQGTDVNNVTVRGAPSAQIHSGASFSYNLATGVYADDRGTTSPALGMVSEFASRTDPWFVDFFCEDAPYETQRSLIIPADSSSPAHVTDPDDLHGSIEYSPSTIAGFVSPQCRSGGKVEVRDPTAGNQLIWTNPNDVLDNAMVYFLNLRTGTWTDDTGTYVDTVLASAFASRTHSWVANYICLNTVPNPGTITKSVSIPYVAPPSSNGGMISMGALAALLPPSPSTTAYLASLRQSPGCPRGYVCLPASAHLFLVDLGLGSNSPDVQFLQQYLNAHGFRVASSGPGSPGHETTFFGGSTQAALAAFQRARGISPAAGYFGLVTRTYVQYVK